MNNRNFHVLIVAGGTGSRTDANLPKQYLNIAGKPLLRHTIDVFTSLSNKLPAMRSIRVVINPSHVDMYEKAIKGAAAELQSPPVYGGSSRKQSVYNGIKSYLNSDLDIDDNDIILVHDAARPFVTHQEIINLLSVMDKYSAASLAVPASDTMVYADDDLCIGERIKREQLFSLQTPQAFHYGIIRQAHEKAANDGRIYTDDTSLVSLNLGEPVKIVTGSKNNFKITFKEDIAMAEMLLNKNNNNGGRQSVRIIRTGLGSDVHAFDKNATDKNAPDCSIEKNKGDAEEANCPQSVRLCGIDIPYKYALKGHSDADVAMHALTDALLGALGEADIGTHFPPSNNDYKDMDSSIFLKHAVSILNKKCAVINNADITIICEEPKILPYRQKIVQNISKLLNIDEGQVNIKATTTERLGFTGRKEGIAAQAIVTISLPSTE